MYAFLSDHAFVEGNLLGQYVEPLNVLFGAEVLAVCHEGHAVLRLTTSLEPEYLQAKRSLTQPMEQIMFA